ncbi:AMP-binding protein [Pseudooctadecabacter sp.]|uniref:AMP-binding protein n=1 Tax=Pseudooctadecabacter sp. TaxID=1966338 RepID=UPI0035C7B019
MTNLLYDALIAPHRGNTAPFLALDSGTTLSFDDFTKRAAQIAHVLVHNGVKPGDRVVVQAPKCADFLALYAACLQSGAVFLPLNTAYTQAELRYFIEDADPALVVCAPAAIADITPISAPRPVLTLGTIGTGTLSHAADAAPTTFQTVPRGADDLAGLLYTSGTTGRSKGAMMSHRNLLSNAHSLKGLWQITNQDRLIHALPVFHTHGLFVAMNTALLAGAQVRLMGAFDLDTIFDELPRSTLMMGVPTFYTRLLADPRLTRDRAANMRLFISGSAPLLAETHRAFEDRTGHRILERYGMTETNMITSNPYDGPRIAGTVGMALPGVEVRIRTDGQPTPAGDIGTLEVRGANVFQGYWNMPDKTAEDMTTDGFFITGDLATMDADARVTIVGRAKDLIISGGYNIYPKEIEDVLNAVPGVLETAVFGVPDADFGETTVAAIVPTDADTPPDDATLTQAVTAALARFKHPRRYVVLPALPRNTMGKVQKTQLRADHG